MAKTKKLGTLTVWLTANTGKFQKGLSRAKQTMQNFKTAAVAGASVAGVAFIEMSRRAVLAAGDADEVSSKFDTVFSNIGNKADRAAKELSNSFGLASTSAKELLSDTGDLLSGFGFTQEASLELSSEVNKLAVDLASFTNFSGGAKGASMAITKALLGEREALKSLGVSINQKEIAERVAKLTTDGMTFSTERQTKAFATLQLAQEQSKNALGDYQRTQGSFNNQMKLMGERLKELQINFGQLLMAIFDFEGGISDANGAILQLSNYIKENTALWALTFQTAWISFKSAFQKILVFGQLVFEIIALHFVQQYEEIVTITKWAIDASMKLWQDLGGVINAVLNDNIANFQNFGNAVVKFLKNPLEGFDFTPTLKNIQKKLEDLEIKPPDFKDFGDAYKQAMLDAGMKIDDIEQKRIKDISKLMTNKLKKFGKAIPKGAGGAAGKTEKAQETTLKTQFAKAVEKGSIEAYRAEITGSRSNDPQKKIVDNTKKTNELLVDIGKKIGSSLIFDIDGVAGIAGALGGR